MCMLLEVNLPQEINRYKDLTKVLKDGILWTTTPSRKGKTLVLSQFQSHPNNILINIIENNHSSTSQQYKMIWFSAVSSVKIPCGSSTKIHFLFVMYRPTCYRVYLMFWCHRLQCSQDKSQSQTNPHSGPHHLPALTHESRPYSHCYQQSHQDVWISTQTLTYFLLFPLIK